jgi:hypothetical protein
MLWSEFLIRRRPNGVAEVPLTPLAVQSFRDQLRIAGDRPLLISK